MKKRWIWLAVAVVAVIGTGVWMQRPSDPPTVKTAVLTPCRVEQTISCNGVVEAADGVGVFAPIDCYIREVLVEEGQRVQKGDVLAVIDKDVTAEQADTATQVLLAGLDEMLVAPEDGILLNVEAKAGEVLPLGVPCAMLVRPCDLQLRISIRERDLRCVSEGMTVRISGDGFAQGVYDGVLTEIAATASSAGSTTVVEGVVLPNAGEADASFRLGLSAKAVVITSVTDCGYLIPYEAVLADEQGSYMYTLTEGKACAHRLEDAVQLPQGVMVTDPSFATMTIVLEPEKVHGDGAVIGEWAS